MTDRRCGCCEGTEPLTPLPTANRPGLDALRYRVGTHATFLETMLARLTSHRLGDGRRPLQRLTTRALDDPAIALLDAWATVADVLTFYQERIANEGYLLTATERRSVLELARLVGYELRPGVAAGVYLAFTLEKDYEIEVPERTAAQSVPGRDEMPQVFETAEPLAARTRWNAIPARQTRPSFLQPDSTFDAVYVQGAVTNLKTNGAVLFVCGGVQQPYTIRSVEADAEAKRTRVDYGPFGLPAGDAAGGGEAPARVRAIVEEAPLGPPLIRTGALVQALRKPPSLPPPSRFQLARAPERTYSASADLAPRLLTRFVPRLRDTLYTAYAKAPLSATSASLCRVEAFRVKAAPFGYNAPPDLVYDENNVLVGRREWPLMELGATLRVVISSTDDDQTVAQAFEGLFNLGEAVNPLRLDVSIGDGPGVALEMSPLTEESAEEDGALRFVTSRVLADGTALDFEALYNGAFADDANLLHVEVRAVRGDGKTTSVRVMRTPTINGAPHTFDLVIDNDPSRALSFGEETVDFIGNRVVVLSLDGGLHISHRTPLLAGQEQLRTLSLDVIYDAITKGSWVVVERPARPEEVFRVEQVRTVSRADYGISARVTQLVLDRPWLSAQDTSLAVIRGTIVYAQSESLDLAEEPIEEDVGEDEIELDGLYDGLEAGRWLMVTGERTDIADKATGMAVEGVEARELVLLAGVEHRISRVPVDGETIELPGDTLHTHLILSDPLAYTYKRETVRVNANIVRATHGETRREVLGSGDGARALQRFTLKQSPLTYVAAPTPRGVESTLEVRVDDVRWPEQETLLFLGDNERGYETKTDDEAKTTVLFGDGKRGARLPTGVENVTAVYRSGIGKEGNIAADQISTLATRPLGVKEVINPQRASGGADPESRDQARRNVPLAVLALDRLVSVEDYAAFSRRFAGIGRASAVRVPDGRRETVYLTLAGADDVPVDPGSDLHRNLQRALHRFGDPNVPLRVEPREAVFLFVSARVKVLEDFLWEKVEPKVRAALLEAFGFDRRELAQDVLLSEVIATVQAVEGVDYVDVDLLEGVSETDAIEPETLAAKLASFIPSSQSALAPGDEAASSAGESEPAEPQPKRRLVVETARVDPDATDPKLRLRPAQLAYLNPDLPDTLILTEVTS